MGSIDAVVLYPSLDVKKSAKLVGEFVRKSGMKFSNLDWEWALRYLALANPEIEIVRKGLSDLVPRRRSRQEKEPTVMFVDTEDTANRWKSPKDPKKLTEENKGRIIEAMVETLIKPTFDTHYYKWEGEIRN